jgi:hypothetical protein
VNVHIQSSRKKIRLNLSRVALAMVPLHRRKKKRLTFKGNPLKELVLQHFSSANEISPEFSENSTSLTAFVSMSHQRSLTMGLL